MVTFLMQRCALCVSDRPPGRSAERGNGAAKYAGFRDVRVSGRHGSFGLRVSDIVIREDSGPEDYTVPHLKWQWGTASMVVNAVCDRVVSRVCEPPGICAAFFRGCGAWLVARHGESDRGWSSRPRKTIMKKPLSKAIFSGARCRRPARMRLEYFEQRRNRWSTPYAGWSKSSPQRQPAGRRSYQRVRAEEFAARRTSAIPPLTSSGITCRWISK